MTNNIPDLTIERNDDGTITLEQNWSGNVDRVAVHLVHVRHLAELVGLIGGPRIEGGDIQCLPPSLDEVKRDNDRLKRNMLRVREHALTLQHDFATGADWAHADLVEPMNQINALISLFDMAVDDFADDYTAHPPSANAVVTGDQSAKRSPATPAVQSRTECGIGKVEQMELPA